MLEQIKKFLASIPEIIETFLDSSAFLGNSSIEVPIILTSPEVFTTVPAKIFIKVDLPAPFGPSKPLQQMALFELG